MQMRFQLEKAVICLIHLENTQFMERRARGTIHPFGRFFEEPPTPINLLLDRQKEDKQHSNVMCAKR
jgi:hypothetical protein